MNSDIFYIKHLIEGPLRLMDCDHERIFYRDVGETFQCFLCGHVNGAKIPLPVGISLLSPEEAWDYLEKFFTAYPEVRKYHRKVEESIRQNNPVREVYISPFTGKEVP